MYRRGWGRKSANKRSTARGKIGKARMGVRVKGDGDTAFGYYCPRGSIMRGEGSWKAIATNETD